MNEFEVFILDGSRELLASDVGAKAASLNTLSAWGLRVPEAVATNLAVSQARLDAGVSDDALTRLAHRMVGCLEGVVGLRMLDPVCSLRVSVRSAGTVSLPGIMSTVLDVGAVSGNERKTLRAVARAIDSVLASAATPAALFAGSDGLTGVIVQRMVFGDAPGVSGAGTAVLVPGTWPPFVEWVAGQRGDALMSGASTPRGLEDLIVEHDAVAEALLQSLSAILERVQVAAEVEFTIQSGEIYLLQFRPFSGRPSDPLIGKQYKSETEHMTVLTGTLGSSGNAHGRAHIWDGRRLPEDLGDIVVVVCEPLTSAIALSCNGAAGVVADRGGITAHGVAILRSLRIPCLMSVGSLQSVRPGDLLTIDGAEGTVGVRRP